jgi:hypothetical protein
MEDVTVKEGETRTSGYDALRMSAREEQPATVPPPAGEDDAYNAATKVGAMPAEVMARLRAEGLLPEEPSDPPPVGPPPSVPRLTGQESALPSVNSSAPPTPRPLPDLFGDPLPILDAEDRYGETGLPQIRLETPINELKSDPNLAAASSRPPLPVLGTSRPPPPPRPTSRPPVAVASRPPQSSPLPAPSHPPRRPDASHPPIGFPSAPPPSGSGYPAALQSSGMQMPSMSQVPPPPISEPALQREIRAFSGTRLSKAQRIIVLVAALGLVVAFAFLMALLSQRR